MPVGDQRATVYLRGNVLIIGSSDRSDQGLWIAGPYSAAITTHCSDAALGAVVDDALRSSRHEVPHPSRQGWKDLGKPRAEVTGIKSWKRVAKGAYSTSVSRGPDGVEVMPSKNLGTKRGFERLPDRAETSSNASLTELGALVRRGLANSTVEDET